MPIHAGLGFRVSSDYHLLKLPDEFSSLTVESLPVEYLNSYRKFHERIARYSDALSQLLLSLVSVVVLH